MYTWHTTAYRRCRCQFPPDVWGACRYTNVAVRPDCGYRGRAERSGYVDPSLPHGLRRPTWRTHRHSRLRLEGIDQRRAASIAFGDEHIAALHSLNGIENLLRDAEALAAATTTGTPATTTDSITTTGIDAGTGMPTGAVTGTGTATVTITVGTVRVIATATATASAEGTDTVPDTSAFTTTTRTGVQRPAHRRSSRLRSGTDTIAHAHTGTGKGSYNVQERTQATEQAQARAAEESLMSPVRSQVAEIARCNTAIMAQLAQNAPNHSTIDAQAQKREDAVAKLYNAVASSRAQLVTITDECNDRATGITAMLDTMSGAPFQAVNVVSSNASPTQLILKTQRLLDAVKRDQAPLDTLVASALPLIQGTAEAAMATAEALTSRGTE